MKFGKKLTITAIAVFVVGYAGYEINAYVNGTGPSCSEITYDQAIGTISKDFLEYRMPRWDRDVEKLGTRKPELAFNKENTQITDAYFVPFKATGTKGIIDYFAIYECKTGSIEYSVK